MNLQFVFRGTFLKTVHYWSHRNMKYLGIILLKYVFKNLPFLFNSFHYNNHRLLVALKILYNSQVFPWCFWKTFKYVCCKTPWDVSGLRPVLSLIPSIWIQLQQKQQQKQSVFLYWSHRYSGPDQSPQSELISLTRPFVRVICKMNYWKIILVYFFSIFVINGFPEAIHFLK